MTELSAFYWRENAGLVEVIRRNPSKGRRPGKGSAGFTKKVRALHDEKVSTHEIAKKFGVSQRYIQRVLKGKP